MVDFHGAYLPDGFERTYPNLMTREGVMGEEYAKFSDFITPEHNVTLAFTRLIAGQMDYTPGGFLNIPAAYRYWKDGAKPDEAIRGQDELPLDRQLTVTLASGGGFVAIVE